jgi:hypothetical protein
MAELKSKAEEVLRTINQNPSIIPIKMDNDGKLHIPEAYSNVSLGIVEKTLHGLKTWNVDTQVKKFWETYQRYPNPEEHTKLFNQINDAKRRFKMNEIVFKPSGKPNAVVKSFRKQYPFNMEDSLRKFYENYQRLPDSAEDIQLFLKQLNPVLVFLQELTVKLSSQNEMISAIKEVTNPLFVTRTLKFLILHQEIGNDWNNPRYAEQPVDDLIKGTSVPFTQLWSVQKPKIQTEVVNMIPGISFDSLDRLIISNTIPFTFQEIVKALLNSSPNKGSWNATEDEIIVDLAKQLDHKKKSTWTAIAKNMSGNKSTWSVFHRFHTIIRHHQIPLLSNQFTCCGGGDGGGGGGGGGGGF